MFTRNWWILAFLIHIIHDYSYVLSVNLIGRKPLIEIWTRLLSSTMAQALQTHGVVPDVIDKVPQDVLQVTYPNGISVDIGKVLTPTQVKDQPTVTWNADANAYYTLCMTGTYSYAPVYYII